MKYEYGYPPNVNAYPEHCANVVSVGTDLVGKERASVQCVTMGAEDFSYYLLQRPGCFFFVGVHCRERFGDIIRAYLTLMNMRCRYPRLCSWALWQRSLRENSTLYYLPPTQT